MSIYTICRRCQTKNYIKTNATNRSDLEREKAEIIILRCKKCAEEKEYHVNDFSAEVNNNLIIGGVVLGLIVTVIMWQMLAGISTLSMIIPIIVWRQQQASVNTFNSYRVKEVHQAKR